VAGHPGGWASAKDPPATSVPPIRGRCWWSACPRSRSSSSIGEILWWLAPVAALSYALAVLGRYAATRQFHGWSHAYVHGQGGSYIALVTALVVVALTVDGPLAGPIVLLPWLLPTAVGKLLIEWWRRRLLRTRTIQ
jgi:hypothetical protein